MRSTGYKPGKASAQQDWLQKTCINWLQEWDFRPWLCEKLNSLQRAAKGLVGYWLTEPNSVVLHKEAPVTARDWLRQMIALHFGELKQKARTVFEEVCSDKLEIKQTGDDQRPK